MPLQAPRRRDKIRLIYHHKLFFFLIPLKEIGVFNAGGNFELHYEYMDEDGTKKSGDIVYPVRVDIEDEQQQ